MAKDRGQNQAGTNSASRPTAVDLFCGIGGMGLGFEQAGFDVVASMDIDPVLSAVHEYNHPRTRMVCRDIGKLKTADVGEALGVSSVDVVFGGPPCQGFSSIGKRQADDPRNSLINDFIRVATALSPRYIVMENVAGLASKPSRGRLSTLRASLARAGYRSAEPKILNAAEFGVPQRRRRVFLLAWKDGEQELRLPSPTHSFEAADGVLVPTLTVFDAIGDLRPRAKKISDYALRLKARSGVNDFGYDRGLVPECISGMELTEHTKKTKDRFEATEPGKVDPVSRYQRLAWEGQCPTLRAGTGPEHGAFMSARPIHPSEPRVITVREAARLHGYPDWFQFHATKWHSFRGIGNSVPPIMASKIAQQVMKAMSSQGAKADTSRVTPDIRLLTHHAESAAIYFGVASEDLPKRNRQVDVERTAA